MIFGRHAEVRQHPAPVCRPSAARIGRAARRKAEGGRRTAEEGQLGPPHRPSSLGFESRRHLQARQPDRRRFRLRAGHSDRSGSVSLRFPSRRWPRLQTSVLGHLRPVGPQQDFQLADGPDPVRGIRVWTQQIGLQGGARLGHSIW